MKNKLLLIITLFILMANTICHSQITTFLKTYGGNNDDYAVSIHQTVDGGFIIAGQTATYGNSNASNMYLLRTNIYGDTLWTATFDSTTVNDIRQTSDKGFILTGGDSVILIKLDSFGATQWKKNYGNVGGNQGNEVHQTRDGGYIIVGYGAMFLIKTDANGTIQWVNNYSDGENFNSVEQTADGGYIIAGSTSTFGVGAEDIYLIKTDSMGTITWEYTYGGIATDKAYSVKQTPDKGYVLTGNTDFVSGHADIFLMKTDSVGAIVFAKVFANTDSLTSYSNCVSVTADSGYVITGATNAAVGNQDIFIIKTNANGDTLFTKAYGGGSLDWGYSVEQTKDSGYIIGGATYSIGFGYADLIIIKADSVGNAVCYRHNCAFNVADFVPFITTPATIVTLMDSVTAIIPPPNRAGGGEEFVYCTTQSIAENKTEQQTMEIYPNPNNGEFMLQLTANNKPATIKIMNSMGELVYIASISNSQSTINIHQLNDGIYFVQAIFTSEGNLVKSITQKIIKN